MACKYLYEGRWYTEDQLRAIYNQGKEGKTLPSRASAGTMKKIREFLDRIGVEVQSLAKITYNGQSLGVNGLADPLNGLIQVIEGKEDIALPEEAMHMAVELIEQKDPKLFKEMMDRIGRYDLFDQVTSEYQNNPFYQTKEGRPDIRKIKKEAIGKVLTQTVIDKNQGITEKPELLNQTRTWWQRIVDFLKDLFLRAGFNPFETAAAQVLTGELEGPIESTELPFASRNQNAVNATLKLVSSLRDNRAGKWFKSLPRETFYQKLQQDLQAPKTQVDMLKNWAKDKNIESVGDMIAGVLSELSYTVEINVAYDRAHQSYDDLADYIIDSKDDPETPRPEFRYSVIDREGKTVFQTNDIGEANQKAAEFNRQSLSPSEHYSNLTVPGGTNYRENEIKTPDITPTIKGHAAFSTDQGIGWFRSEDLSINFDKMLEAGIIKEVNC